jgi:hypothetical protein
MGPRRPGPCPAGPATGWSTRLPRPHPGHSRIHGRSGLPACCPSIGPGRPKRTLPSSSGIHEDGALRLCLPGERARAEGQAAAGSERAPGSLADWLKPRSEKGPSKVKERERSARKRSDTTSGKGFQVMARKGSRSCPSGCSCRPKRAASCLLEGTRHRWKPLVQADGRARQGTGEGEASREGIQVGSGRSSRGI